MTQNTETSTYTRRRAAVESTLSDIRALLRHGKDAETLERAARRLEALATQSELFPPQDYPPRSADGKATWGRYRLNPADAEDDIALYLNAAQPGKDSPLHNHGVWAIVVAMQGEEFNEVYRGAAKGVKAGDHAALVQSQAVNVRPGTSICLEAHDLHRIRVSGPGDAVHLHLYEKPLETLADRIHVDPSDGAAAAFSSTAAHPSQVVL